jgi:hypothetical protein
VWTIGAGIPILKRSSRMNARSCRHLPFKKRDELPCPMAPLHESDISGTNEVVPCHTGHETSWELNEMADATGPLATRKSVWLGHPSQLNTAFCHRRDTHETSSPHRSRRTRR